MMSTTDQERARVRVWQAANQGKVRAYRAAWRAANPGKMQACRDAWEDANQERERSRKKAWRVANPEKRRARKKAYRAAHPERERSRHKAYRAANPDKVAADHVRRRAAERQAQPAWADQCAIAQIYKEAARLTRQTGIVHHVDHVYPLAGRTVSGLHVEVNLQILTATENLRKGNAHPIERAA